MENRTQGPGYGHGIRLGVRVFLLVILQVSIIARIGFLGATPDILLPYITALAVTGRGAERWRTAAVSGIAAGFLVDALGGAIPGVLALFYFFVGAFLPRLVRRSFRGVIEEGLCFYAALVPCALLRTGVTLFYILMARPSGFSLLACATGTLLPEFLGTLLFSIPVFLLFRGRD